MILKKINAVLGLTIIGFLLGHIFLSLLIKITDWYLPFLPSLFSMGLLVTNVFHVVLSVLIVFFYHDRRRYSYPRYNASTILQHFSGILTFLLVVVHMNSNAYLESIHLHNAVEIGLRHILTLFYYPVVSLHVIISFPRGIITLGLVRTERTLQRIQLSAAMFLTLVTVMAIIIQIKTS